MLHSKTARDSTNILIIGLTTNDLHKLRLGGGHTINIPYRGPLHQIILMWGTSDQHIAAEFAKNQIKLLS